MIIMADPFASHEFGSEFPQMIVDQRPQSLACGFVAVIPRPQQLRYFPWVHMEQFIAEMRV